jgi:methylase of polypeptide subunit release factors
MPLQPQVALIRPRTTCSIRARFDILLMDAILAYDEQGKPVEPEWPEADVIIGNPPFLGDKKMRRELGDKYVEELRKLYEGGVPGGADLVTYWFERARALIAAGRLKRAGLLQYLRQSRRTESGLAHVNAAQGGQLVENAGQ